MAVHHVPAKLLGPGDRHATSGAVVVSAIPAPHDEVRVEWSDGTIELVWSIVDLPIVRDADPSSFVVAPPTGAGGGFAHGVARNH